MRLLFAANTPPDPDLGASGSDLATIAALRRLGHEVDEIWEPARPRRIRHGNLHQLLELPRAYVRAVEARFREAAYDVVQVNQPHAYLAARRHRRLRRPSLFVNRSHGWEPRVAEALRRHGALDAGKPFWRRQASRLLRRLTLRHNALVARAADGIVVCSAEDRDDVLRRHGVDGERVLSLAPGVEPAFLDEPPPPPDDERARRLLYVGQFTPVKAPEMVAGAAGLLLRDDPRITLTWVCAAAHHGAALALFDPAVRARVRLRAWMPRAELRAVYDAHGLLLFPSHFEGFGLVFLEGLARGLGVAATRVGGMREVLRHGMNGLLVEPGDVAGLAREARAFVQDASLRRRLAEEGRRTAVLFTWERAARELVAFYLRLAAVGHARRV